MAYFIDGKRVKLYWWVVLTAAKDEGVDFTVTSGFRTMEQQRELRRTYERVGWPIAAKPSIFAPHIRVGRQDHAVDVNSLDGGETRLQNWFASKDVKWKNTVAGESWHGEVSLKGLTKLYLKYRKTAYYPAKARRWIREYNHLTDPKGSTKRPQRVAVLKREMAKLAKTYPKNSKVRKSLEARSR